MKKLITKVLLIGSLVTMAMATYATPIVSTLNVNATEKNNHLDDTKTVFSKITSTSRQRGSMGEINTANYIKLQLDTMGYETQIIPFPVYKNSLIHDANDFFNINPFNEEPLLTAHNIIAEKNFDPNKKTIIFSAHYDTTKDNNGYLDNGSGVTVLLEAAKLIEPYIENLNYNVRIIFFSSEEYYLTGSKTYLLNLTQEELDNIIGCVNIDLTSTKKCRELIINGNKSKLSDEFLRLNSNFNQKTNDKNLFISDHVSFEEKSIMSFSFNTTNILAQDFPGITLVKETKNEYVDIDLIKKDASIVFNFMKNLDIKNVIDKNFVE